MELRILKQGVCCACRNKSTKGISECFEIHHTVISKGNNGAIMALSYVNQVVQHKKNIPSCHRYCTKVVSDLSLSKYAA